jgi:cytochrome P450
LVGALPTMMLEQFVALDRWQRELGGVFEVPLGLTSFIMVCKADPASEMLVDKGRNFIRSGPAWASLNTLLGTGMLGSDGEPWRVRRRLIQPHLHQEAIRQLVVSMAEAIDEVLDSWAERRRAGDPDQPFDIEHEVAQVTMAVILRVLFGTKITDSYYQRAAATLRLAIDGVALGWLTDDLPAWLPVPGRTRYRRAIAEIDAMVFELAEQRRASGRYTDDLLGMLVGLREAGELDAKGLRDESVSLFVAGYETTAKTLGFGLWELARRADLQARLRDEAEASLGSAGSVPDIAAIAGMTQCNLVFREGLRMYPGALWLPRFAVEDCTLSGLPIRAGSTAVVSIYNVHRDPDVWDQPNEFRPERHDDLEPQQRKAWMPFGLGQHMCVGQRLAMAEGPLILARVAQRFDLAPIEARVPKMRMSTALKTADGIWVRVRARS